jgi:hypothetical protein
LDISPLPSSAYACVIHRCPQTKGRANYSMNLERYEPVPSHIQTQICSEKAAAKAAA